MPYTSSGTITAPAYITTTGYDPISNYTTGNYTLTSTTTGTLDARKATIQAKDPYRQAKDQAKAKSQATGLVARYSTGFFLEDKW